MPTPIYRLPPDDRVRLVADFASERVRLVATPLRGYKDQLYELVGALICVASPFASGTVSDVAVIDDDQRGIVWVSLAAVVSIERLPDPRDRT